MTAEFERRLRTLALREGMNFTIFITLDEADRAVLRATILCRFDAGAA
jgi:hypothetical protein